MAASHAAIRRLLLAAAAAVSSSSSPPPPSVCRALVDVLASLPHHYAVASDSSTSMVTASCAVIRSRIRADAAAAAAAAAASASSSSPPSPSACRAMIPYTPPSPSVYSALVVSQDAEDTADPLCILLPVSPRTSYRVPSPPQKFPWRGQPLSVYTTSRLFTSAPVMTASPPLVPRNIDYLIALLKGITLTFEEELMFRKAFNEKFKHFKVADVLTHLVSEDFTFLEWSMIHGIVKAKLGVSQEAATEELQHQLGRIENKVDVLTEQVIEGSSKILKCVQQSGKG